MGVAPTGVAVSYSVRKHDTPASQGDTMTVITETTTRANVLVEMMDSNGGTITVPENLAYMAQNANTEMARVQWLRICEKWAAADAGIQEVHDCETEEKHVQVMRKDENGKTVKVLLCRLCALAHYQGIMDNSESTPAQCKRAEKRYAEIFADLNPQMGK